MAYDLRITFFDDVKIDMHNIDENTAKGVITGFIAGIFADAVENDMPDDMYNSMVENAADNAMTTGYLHMEYYEGGDDDQINITLKKKAYSR